MINLYLTEGHHHDEMEEEFLVAAADVLAGVIQRKRAEEALSRSHHLLELQIQERTAELVVANEELRLEVAERRRAEDLLQRAVAGTVRAMALTVDTIS